MINEVIKKFANINLVFYIMLAIFVILIWKNQDISFMLFIALVFASSLNPLVDKLSKKMNRRLASVVVLFGVLLIIMLFLVPIIVLCAHQVSLFVDEFPKYINNIDQFFSKYPVLTQIGVEKFNLDEVLSSAANYSSTVMHAIMSFFSGLSSLSLYFLITLIFIYFFIADKEYIKNSTLKLFPKEVRPKTEEIIDRIGERIGGYVVAQICAIISVGIVMTIGLLLFKVPYAFLLGFITAVLDIIPIIGPAIALIIGIVATYEFGFKTVIIVCLVFTAAQFVENNFVRPYAFGKLLNLHPMLIFIFLFLGTKYFGLLGTLFAPAIAASICVLVEELYIKKLNQ